MSIFHATGLIYTQRVRKLYNNSVSLLTQFETVHLASQWISSTQRDVSSRLDKKRTSDPRSYRRRHQPVGDQCPARQPEATMCDLHRSYALLCHKIRAIVINNIWFCIKKLYISSVDGGRWEIRCRLASKIILYWVNF